MISKYLQRISGPLLDRVCPRASIADPAGLEALAVEYMAEAVQHRRLDRKFWG